MRVPTIMTDLIQNNIEITSVFIAIFSVLSIAFDLFHLKKKIIAIIWFLFGLLGVEMDIKQK